MERTVQYRLASGLSKLIDSVITFMLALALLYAGYALWDTWHVLNAPNSVQQQLMEYKPGDPEDLAASFEELLAINPDVCAWITIDGTGIDYVVVQGTDNYTYLDKDVYGSYSAAGSIFLDSGNSRGFTDSYCILMGHHMQGGAMFGDLDLFLDEAFFRANTTGTLYLPDKILALETVAVIQADAYDKIIYGAPVRSDDGFSSLILRINELAVYTRSNPLTQKDQIIALSTCSSSYTNARILLICRVTGENMAEKGSDD